MRRIRAEHDLSLLGLAPSRDGALERLAAASGFELRLWGHRGASAERPENTLEAFERALELGANALELDVHLTLDREVVVMHDPTGERIAGRPERVSRTSLRKMRQWDLGGTIATLDDVLALEPAAHLSVDIKPRDLSAVAKVLEVIRRHDAERRVTLASFHSSVQREARKQGYRGPTALGQAEVVRLFVLPTLAQRLFRPRGAAAQVPLRHGPLTFGTRSFIDKCHSLGLRVDFWTVNDPAVAERLLALGADGIMTDDPGRLRPLFDSRWAGATDGTAVGATP